jgi:Flp pilus assembly protein TadB
MSKQRARRREEREREAGVRAAARAAAEERAERRAARRRAVTSVLPAARPRPTGVLAQRRRNQTLATIAILVLVNVTSFAFLEHWAARALVVIVSLLAAPVLHTLLFRRR